MEANLLDQLQVDNELNNSLVVAYVAPAALDAKFEV